MTSLPDAVAKVIERDNLLSRGTQVVVGVSGGPDSLCLLHVLWSLRKRYAIRLHVAHLNHGLRGTEADQDAEFVAKLASDWGIPAHVETCDAREFAQANRLAIEEASRQARYAFLGRVAQSVRAKRVAVGHNADDQVETVLMHWLRGTGLAGLRGMLTATPLSSLRLAGLKDLAHGDGSDLLLIRPLLETTRSEIEAYCAAAGLQPRFDRTNLDTTFFRNRLRHQLLPVLEQFNPRVREVLRRSAQIIAADYEVLQRQVDRAWRRVVIAQDTETIVLDLKRWKRLPLGLQRAVFRSAVHHLRRSLRNINWVHVEDVVQALQHGRTGQSLTLPRGLRATVSYGQVLLADEGHSAPRPDAPWLDGSALSVMVPGVTALPGGQWSLVSCLLDSDALTAETLQHASRWQAYLDRDVAGEGLVLRPRRTGDRFWPQGLGERPTSLGNFMTNVKIPVAWRNDVPLLASPQQVLWVVGWRIDERAKVTERTRRVLALRLERTETGE